MIYTCHKNFHARKLRWLVNHSPGPALWLQLLRTLLSIFGSQRAPQTHFNFRERIKGSSHAHKYTIAHSRHVKCNYYKQTCRSLQQCAFCHPQPIGSNLPIQANEIPASLSHAWPAHQVKLPSNKALCTHTMHTPHTHTKTTHTSTHSSAHTTVIIQQRSHMTGYRIWTKDDREK